MREEQPDQGTAPGGRSEAAAGEGEKLGVEVLLTLVLVTPSLT